MYRLGLLAVGCSTVPPAIEEAALQYDGSPVTLSSCTAGCTEANPCGGETGDLHGRDVDSFTATVTLARIRLWDEVNGTGGVYYDGDCVEGHDEPRWDPLTGQDVLVFVCDREDNLDFGLCWTGSSEFHWPEAPGALAGSWMGIDGALDCDVDGHTLTGTVRCKGGDYPE